MLIKNPDWKETQHNRQTLKFQVFSFYRQMPEIAFENKYISEHPYSII